MNGSRTRTRDRAAFNSTGPQRRPGHVDPGTFPRTRTSTAGKALLAALLLLIIAMLVIAIL